MKRLLALLVLALAPPALAAEGFPPPDRPVADIVSPVWSSGPDREAADEIGQVVRGLGIQPGMKVADIGAGSGFYALRLSRIVGPKGRVYAQDVTPAYLADLRGEVARRKLANVELVRGAPDDPKLPGPVDRALLIHMYHEIAQPYGLLWHLAASLKPGARVGVVDLDRPTERHGTPPRLLRCEFEAVGYRQVSLTTLEGGVGYLAVFTPPAVADRPAPARVKPCRARG